MKEIGRSEWIAHLDRHLAAAPGAVLHDATAGRLVDLFSGKSAPADWLRVVALQERRNTRSGHPYLVLVREDGLHLVVADVGLAFAPSLAASGAVPELPPVVCFRDFLGAESRLRHFLESHPGEPAGPEQVALFLFCVAVVDGARAVGFDVGPEEGQLERLLAGLEARPRG